jgi:hypothetical protein
MAKATATLEVNNSGFKRGFDDMRKHAAGWSNDVKGMVAGAFAFGAIASFVSSFVSSMARVKDLSDRLGQSTETIQRIGNAAKLSGSDLESVIKVLTKLTLEASKSGEAFAKIGISAAEFASANPEQQVIMLAKAYEEASGNQQKMLDLMALLGPKGQDIMIMLAGGVEELNKQLNQVPVVSETAINAMANLDDAIDSFTQHAHESLGAIIGLLGHLGAAAAAVFQTFSGGSFSENYQKNIEGLLDQKPTTEAKKGDGITSADDQKKAEDDKSKADAAAKALEEEMTRLARSRMDDEQKITDLKREQAELAAAAQDKSKSDADRLNAAREVLRVQQEIESIQKRVDDAAAKADEEAEKAIADFYEAEAKAQEEADKEAEDALKEAYEAEAKAAEEAASSAPTIVSSSLASIGGGGSSYVGQGSNPALVESRKQTALLQRLVANTGGTAAMATNSPF